MSFVKSIILYQYLRVHYCVYNMATYQIMKVLIKH